MRAKTGIQCKDHLGNVYPSLSEMCRKYNIGIMTYNGRIKSGWNKEKALVTPATRVTHKPCDDFKGKHYRSKAEKCREYGIEPHAYNERIKKGYSEEEALTRCLSPYSRGPFHDFKGNEYKYFSDMCAAYGKRCECVRRRLKSGKTLEQALTEPLRGRE
jgi:hypothetical protein